MYQQVGVINQNALWSEKTVAIKIYNNWWWPVDAIAHSNILNCSSKELIIILYFLIERCKFIH